MCKPISMLNPFIVIPSDLVLIFLAGPWLTECEQIYNLGRQHDGNTGMGQFKYSQRRELAG